jgi:hypothetical protein
LVINQVTTIPFNGDRQISFCGSPKYVARHNEGPLVDAGFGRASFIRQGRKTVCKVMLSKHLPPFGTFVLYTPVK